MGGNGLRRIEPAGRLQRFLPERRLQRCDCARQAGIRDWALTYAWRRRRETPRLGAYFRLQPDISDYHAAINEIGVIYASAQIHSHWENPKDVWILPGGEAVGGHAFAIVGI